MGQIPRYTKRISSFLKISFIFSVIFYQNKYVTMYVPYQWLPTQSPWAMLWPPTKIFSV